MDSAPKYVPKRRGRPHKLGRKKKRRYPGPGSKLRRIQYKVLNLLPLTHQMVKELARYYMMPMSAFVHAMIEAAFKKILAEVEAEHLIILTEDERIRALQLKRRQEKENAIKNQHQP